MRKFNAAVASLLTSTGIIFFLSFKKVVYFLDQGEVIRLLQKTYESAAPLVFVEGFFFALLFFYVTVLHFILFIGPITCLVSFYILTKKQKLSVRVRDYILLFLSSIPFFMVMFLFIFSYLVI